MSLVAVAGEEVPEGDVVVCGGGDELAAGARPRERADRVHVRLDDLGDAPEVQARNVFQCNELACGLGPRNECCCCEHPIA